MEDERRWKWRTFPPSWLLRRRLNYQLQSWSDDLQFRMSRATQGRRSMAQSNFITALRPKRTSFMSLTVWKSDVFHVTMAVKDTKMWPDMWCAVIGGAFCQKSRNSTSFTFPKSIRDRLVADYVLTSVEPYTATGRTPCQSPNEMSTAAFIIKKDLHMTLHRTF